MSVACQLSKEVPGKQEAEAQSRSQLCLLTSVIMGKSLCLSESQFSHLKQWFKVSIPRFKSQPHH